jgi:hypothetical protein
MEIIAIISSILCILLGYTTYNMLKKVELYEEYIDEEIKNNETLLETLRKIDNKQMFEKDDEVGGLFDQIKNTIIRFKKFANAQEETT